MLEVEITRGVDKNCRIPEVEITRGVDKNAECVKQK
jgi:hypothetical protein